MRAAVAGSGDRTLPPVLPVFPQEYTVDIPENRGSETVCRMEVTAAQRAARDKIAAGLALPGTLTVRAYRCGKARCRCRADPPRLHGPYAEWTRKMHGKTVTRRLTDAELADYQPMYGNARKLRAPLADLQDLTLQIIEAAPAGTPVNQHGRRRGRTPARGTKRLKRAPVRPGQGQT